MRFSRFFLGVIGTFALSLSAIGAAGCSSDDFENTPPKGEPKPDGGPAPGCKPTGEPDVPDDSFVDADCDGIDGQKSNAVFVSAEGSAGAAGTIDAPVRTITEGVQLALSSTRDVYVCNGTYAENLTLDKVTIRIFGGFDCKNGWTRGDQHASVAPASGKALRIIASESVWVDGLDFKAASATKPGESSIAVVVQNSKAKIRRSNVEAGNGAPGQDGAPAEVVTTPPPKGKDGESATGSGCASTGATGSPCDRQTFGGEAVQRSLTCPGASGSYVVGWGGAGEWIPDVYSGPMRQTAGGAGLIKEGSSLRTASGGTFTATLGEVLGTSTEGAPGASGANGGPGAPATLSFGTVREGEYIPASGGSNGAGGGVGVPGGGGGGGAAYGAPRPYAWFPGGAGGDGGSPGCGGAPGRGGGGGGAAIALFTIDSDVLLGVGAIKRGNGGKGGDPTVGAKGQPGGAPGLGGKGLVFSAAAGSPDGKPGGKSGDGGSGGPGGPGAGGPSIGIVAIGAEPLKSVFTQLPGGAGGKGGKLLGGTTPAKDGLTQDIYLLPKTP